MAASSDGSGFDVETFEETRRLFDPNDAVLPEDALRGLVDEVVTRLLTRRKRQTGADGLVSDHDLETFCHALLAREDSGAADMIQKLLRAGASFDHIYLGYVAGSAEKLGIWWEEDRIDFVQMTISAGRILGILRALRHHFRPRRVSLDRSAVFMSVPGEDHVIGVTMMADVLRREGWQISLKVGMNHDELVEELGQSGYPIIGISASTPERLVALTQLVVGLRVENPGALILVGGQITAHEADLKTLTGADAVAGSVEQAGSEMERLYRLALERGL